MIELPKILDVARRAVAAGGAASLRHFRRGVAVERKADRSPVTIADKESEAAIVNVIRDAFPDHALLTEESGVLGEKSESRWIVDPLDGTKGFSRGGVFWGPLVALEHRGRIVAGAMAMPALGESYWAARGMGAFKDGERLRVSGVANWEWATLSLGEMKGLLSPPLSEGVIALVRGAESIRCVGDLAGCAMLLTGRAEAWIEAGVQIWDLAPLQILVEEAGGRFTDVTGEPTISSGNAVATNGLLHDHVLSALGSPRAT